MPPPQQLRQRSSGDRRAVEFFAPRIDEPSARFLSEFRAEIKSVGGGLATDHIVRSFAELHLRGRSGPRLILQFRSLQADGVIEARDETMRILHKIDRRALMGQKPMSVNEKFIALGFTAKNRVIVEH